MSEREPSQVEQLLALLRARGSLGVTPLDALDAIGSFRLGARVWDLRNAGHPIRRDWTTTVTGARIARYVLKEVQTRDPRVADGQEALPW